MNTMELHVMFLAIPAVLAALLSAAIWSRKGLHPASYKLPEPWTHAPILWAATDEAVGHGHGHSDFSVGGGASGKW